MIFQFFLILTLSSVKVFASSEEDEYKKMVKRWEALDDDHKGAINYLNNVDSLSVDDLFTMKLPEISVGAIEINKQEYTTVLKEIWKLNGLPESSLILDFNNDQVNNDKRAKAVLTQVDEQWDSNNLGKFKAYFSRVMADESKNSDLTRAVMSRFARFLPDDRNDVQKPNGIFYKLRKNFGGILSDQLMGNECSDSDSVPSVNFLNLVIKLSNIKKNPQSNIDDLEEISTLLEKFKVAAGEEKKAIEEEKKAGFAPDIQNTGEVEAKAREAKKKAEGAATNVLKKLNDVWVKLETGDTPPSEVTLKAYVLKVLLQPVCDTWFPSLIKSDAFTSVISQDIISNPTGIFKTLKLCAETDHIASDPS